MPKTRPPYSPAFRRQMVPLIGAGAVLSPHSPRTVIAGEEFTVEVRGVFDDVEDISAVRYNSLEGATGRAGKRGAHELPQIVPGRARPKAASLADRSFIEGKTRDQRNRGRRTGGLPAEADPAAGAALCRAQALAADRAAGDGRRWQGRHRQPRLRRLQRSGHDGDWLQAAHTCLLKCCIAALICRIAANCFVVSISGPISG